MAWTQGEKTAMGVFGLALAGVGFYVFFDSDDEVPDLKFNFPFGVPLIPAKPAGIPPIIGVPEEPVVIIPSKPVIPPITGVPVVEPPLPPIVAVPQIVVPDVFMASPKTCSIDGDGFNIIQWSQTSAGASRVAEVMTILGFPISGAEILAADRKRSKSRRIWNTGGLPATRSDKIRAFQAALISRAVPPYILADPDEIDGIMGECSLIGLTNAVVRFNAGEWPVP